MYRITDISINIFKYKHVRISALYESYKITCRDGDKVVELSFPNNVAFKRDSFMTYIREYYGIEELSGVGENFLFVFTEVESKLLSYLTWNGVLGADSNLQLSNDLLEIYDSEHLIFLEGTKYLTLTDILLNMHEKYIICDNLLIIGSKEYLSYKISDVSKFNALLIKIIVLGKV